MYFSLSLESTGAFCSKTFSLSHRFWAFSSKLTRKSTVCSENKSLAQLNKGLQSWVRITSFWKRFRRCCSCRRHQAKVGLYEEVDRDGEVFFLAKRQDAGTDTRPVISLDHHLDLLLAVRSRCCRSVFLALSRPFTPTSSFPNFKTAFKSLPSTTLIKWINHKSLFIPKSLSITQVLISSGFHKHQSLSLWVNWQTELESWKSTRWTDRFKRYANG